MRYYPILWYYWYIRLRYTLLRLLYLLGYRNHGAFHEDCTISIAQDVVKLLSPKWLRIGGYWYPRGGIPIDIFWQTCQKPKDLFIPDHSVENFKGRG